MDLKDNNHMVDKEADKEAYEMRQQLGIWR